MINLSFFVQVKRHVVEMYDFEI